jgi:ankyrin repeat protein
LIEAARYGMVYTVQRIITAEETFDINAEDKEVKLMISLYIWSKLYFNNCLLMMLQGQEYTALIWACDEGHVNIVELLIKANADINKPDKV